MDQIFRKRELSERLQISGITIWRWVRAGLFPKPIKLGPNTIGWRECDIDEWLSARAAKDES